MPTQTRTEDLARQARFIFRGTVQELRATTISHIEPTARTIIVRVDQVLQGPEMLSNSIGQHITVQLSGRQRVKQGAQAIFYTNGWLLGESIAVQSVGHELVRGVSALMASAGGDHVHNLEHRDLREHIASADLVVSGRVTSVREPTQEITAVRASGDQTSGPSTISEHDPIWQEAVVSVDSVESGDPVQGNVIVRFPASDDVRWYKAPKFQPGYEGVFVLHKAEAPQAPALAEATRATQEQIYTALHPHDFHPADQLPRLRRVIAISSRGTNAQ